MSYSKFLKAYVIKEAKGFFLTNTSSVTGRKETPPHSAFYNNLQQKNISEEDSVLRRYLAETEHDLFKRLFRVV